MLFNFLGDSIVQGVGTEKHEETFPYIVSKFFNAIECNYGVSGTRIAFQKKPSQESITDEQFITRALKMPKDADFTFVLGGTNDFGHGDAALGKVGDVGQNTFYGAFYNLADFLKNVYRDKLCFILPLPRFDQDNPYGEWSKKEEKGSLLEEYINVEKDILNLLKIDYLDLSKKLSVPPSSQGNDWTNDGAHPNKKGHKIISNCIIEYLNKKTKKTKIRK